MFDLPVIQFALLAFALLSLCASAVAVRSFKRINVLQEENARRTREITAYKSLSIDPESYGVPDAVVEECRPVRIPVGDTFILAGMLKAEKLAIFTREYALFLGKFRQYADALSYILTGEEKTGNECESFRALLNDPTAKNMLVGIVEKTILSNAVANPNGVTAEDFAANYDPDQFMRLMTTLWLYNLGDHFKKKLQIQTRLIQRVMEWDLSGLPSLASPQTNTVVNLSPVSRSLLQPQPNVQN